MLGKLVLAAALLMPGNLHYNSTVNVPCNGKVAYETVTYTFAVPVQGALLVAKPLRGGPNKVELVSGGSARPVTLRIPFTWPAKGFTPQTTVYVATLTGYSGHTPHYAPKFEFTVKFQSLGACFPVAKGGLAPIYRA